MKLVMLLSLAGMGETVRFSELVKLAGRPEIYLPLSDPKLDRNFVRCSIAPVKCGSGAGGKEHRSGNQPALQTAPAPVQTPFRPAQRAAAFLRPTFTPAPQTQPALISSPKLTIDDTSAQQNSAFFRLIFDGIS